MSELNFRQLINAKNLDLLCVCGCTKRQLRQHIETQFKAGMTWENYAIEWEVDHITPVRFFEATRAGRTALHHFSNLQPLWLRKNAKKGNWMSGVRSDDHPVVKAERAKQAAHRKFMAEKWGEGWQALKFYTVFECGDWVMEPTYV